MSDGGLQFEVVTVLGFRVRITRERWSLITTLKHPVMAGREPEVRAALERPDEVRQSPSDPTVLLFYKIQKPGRWICAVVKHSHDSFVITTYPTDSVKEGTSIWPK